MVAKALFKCEKGKEETNVGHGKPKGKVVEWKKTESERKGEKSFLLFLSFRRKIMAFNLLNAVKEQNLKLKQGKVQDKHFQVLNVTAFIQENSFTAT